MYATCALLHNARVCCYGFTTSDYFDVSPPEIGDYFHEVCQTGFTKAK